MRSDFAVAGSRCPKAGIRLGRDKENRDFNDIKVLKVVKVVKVANHFSETRVGLPFALEFAGGLAGYALEILPHERRIREIEFD